MHISHHGLRQYEVSKAEYQHFYQRHIFTFVLNSTIMRQFLSPHQILIETFYSCLSNFLCNIHNDSFYWYTLNSIVTLNQLVFTFRSKPFIKGSINLAINLRSFHLFHLFIYIYHSRSFIQHPSNLYTALGIRLSGEMV